MQEYAIFLRDQKGGCEGNIRGRHMYYLGGFLRFLGWREEDASMPPFEIGDIEYVQRLAFAQRAPQWLRESILSFRRDGEQPRPLSPVERRVVKSMRQLSDEQAERLAERVEGWVDAMSADPQQG